MDDGETKLHRRVANAEAAKRYRQKKKNETMEIPSSTVDTNKQATPKQVQGEEAGDAKAGTPDTEAAKRHTETEKKKMTMEIDVVAPAINMNEQATPKQVDNCSQCNHVVPVGASFCIECGVDLRKACSKCNKKFPVHFFVCTACVVYADYLDD